MQTRLHSEQLVVTASQMRAAEQRAMLGGITGGEMMYAAGTAAAREIMERFRPGHTLILCGPGNNGGDGFVVAEALRRSGWPVEVACMVAPSALKGDARQAAEAYTGDIITFSAEDVKPGLLVVDALFGTGLERPIDGEARQVLSMADTLECPVIAIDIPSGIHADSGQVMGVAAHATLTITFGALKPGHLVYPGRYYSGETVVADIGISREIDAEVVSRKDQQPVIHQNAPVLWFDALRLPQPHSHKYSRGSVLVSGGSITCTGAARLAATAAMRAGAGAATIACDKEALPTYAAHLTSVMTKVVETPEAYRALAEDTHYSTLLLGPGNGVGEDTAGNVATALATQKPCVLDADALTSFEGQADKLFAMIDGPVVLTPHAGEFTRLFPAISGDKITCALGAARLSGAIVVFKGADTVIASPDGDVVINTMAPADLATAGSGDVLAGIIAGLLSTGMPAFKAACAGVWMHGAAAEQLGVGLMAEDLPHAIPETFKYLKEL